MCNYSAVRNWLIGLLAFLAAAMSSTIFALSVRNIPIWGQIAGSISHAAAAIWFAAAIAAAVSAANALQAYCACVANFPTCTEPCNRLKQMLGLITFLSAGM